MQVTMRLIQHLKAQIRTQWPEGLSCLLLGVSGGADSMCLLHLLRQCAEEERFCLEVAHVHHGIRGEAADSDRDFVEEQCKNLGVNFHIEHVNAPELAERDALSLEEAARELRYVALRKIADLINADAIVLAHHQEDQAETVLFHLLRGAAGDGLCGMWPYRKGLFRPVLDVPARNLRLSLAENNWLWREDGTNHDIAFTRNAIRHELIPRVKATLNRDPTGPLTRFAKLQREDQAYLSVLGEQAGSRTELSGEVGNVCFRVGPFKELPHALARRVVLLAWERATGKRTNLALVHVEAVCELCTREKVHAKLDLPEGMKAFRTAEECRIFKGDERGGSGLEEVRSWSHAITLPQNVGETVQIVVPEESGCLFIRRLRPEPGTTCSVKRSIQAALRQTICFEEDQEGIYIRNRNPGDRFRPWRGSGEKKLKEWLIDRKIPAQIRDHIPLVAMGNQVIWVVGHRTAMEPEPGGNEMVHYEMVWEDDSFT